jgi:hypothetical protein
VTLPVNAITPEHARAILHRRLKARQEEIAQTVLIQVRERSGPERSDPNYAEGLRNAVQAAVAYGIDALRREDRPPPVPTALLEQARRAARGGINLDALQRRYLAGYSLLSDYIVEAAEEPNLFQGTALRRLLWTQADLFDRLLELIGEEYARELRQRPASPADRRTERIERLLAGEPLDASDLNYGLDACHVGLIAEGEHAYDALRGLLGDLGLRSILIRRPDAAAWAWCGSRGSSALKEVERRLAKGWPSRVSLALGEPGAGRAGWRLTHQQAKAALPIATRSQRPFVRYRDVALLSAVSRDDLLATSLRQLYLAPLEDEGDGGGPLLETLRAYFASDRNVSSTAAALGVNRRTVANRLRTIEDRLGCSLLTNTAEIAAALRLQELDSTLKR